MSVHEEVRNMLYNRIIVYRINIYIVITGTAILLSRITELIFILKEGISLFCSIISLNRKR